MPSSPRRSRSWTRSATTTPSPSSTRPAAAPTRRAMDDQVPEAVKKERIQRLVDRVQHHAARPQCRAASAPSRRCWSRARAAPTRRCCGAAPAPTRRSTSPATRRPGSWSTSWSRAPPPRRWPAARRRPSPRAVARRSWPSSGRPRRARARSALELAGAIGGEIVSCDAMQIYRGLPILTNQPTRGRAGRPSRTTWSASGSSTTAARWPSSGRWHGRDRRRARARTDAGRLRRQRPLPARRAGDMGRLPSPRSRRREPVRAALRRAGARRSACRCSPSAIPAAAERIHPNDRRRVVRALELAGGPQPGARGDVLWERADRRRPTRIFGLDVRPAGARPPDRRRAREAMFEAGVVDEVRAASPSTAFSTPPAHPRPPGRDRAACAARSTADEASAA